MTARTPVRLLGLGLLAAGLLAGPTAHAADKVMFTKQSTPIFGTKKGKVLGQIPPGTEVKVLQRAGRKVEIELIGWTEEYRELELFKDKELRIEVASLVRVDKKRTKVLGTENGRFEIVWSKVRMTGWIDKRNLVADLEKVWKPARDIHQERCTECHDFMPASELTAQQWSGTLRIMTHRAALTPEEAALIRQYLMSGARERRD